MTSLEVARRFRVDADVRRTFGWGLKAGTVMTFTAAVGMLEAFEDRLLVYPILSLGYLMLLWIVPVAGYRATLAPVREGVDDVPKGRRNLIGGVAVGLMGGVILAVFAMIVDSFDLREVFVAFSPRLVELLTAGGGVPRGLVATVVLPALLGFAGGLMHLFSPVTRRRVILAAEWVVVVAILEQVVAPGPATDPSGGGSRRYLHAPRPGMVGGSGCGCGRRQPFGPNRTKAREDQTPTVLGRPKTAYP